MGIVALVFGLPFAPVRGVIKLGEVIQERVEAEQRDTSSARQELESAERARAEGEISAEEEAEIQDEVVERMTGLKTPDESPGENHGG